MRVGNRNRMIIIFRTTIYIYIYIFSFKTDSRTHGDGHHKQRTIYRNMFTKTQIKTYWQKCDLNQVRNQRRNNYQLPRPPPPYPPYPPNPSLPPSGLLRTPQPLPIPRTFLAYTYLPTPPATHLPRLIAKYQDVHFIVFLKY